MFVLLRLAIKINLEQLQHIDNNNNRQLTRENVEVTKKRETLREKLILF